MRMTSTSYSTTHIPPSLLITCAVLMVARVGLSICDAAQTHPATIVWTKATEDTGNLRGTPLLYFFVDRTDLASEMASSIMETSAFSNREVVKKINTDFVPIKLDIRKDKDGKVKTDAIEKIAKKFHISSTPILLVALPDGTEVGRSMGFRGDRSVLNFLRASLQDVNYELGKALMRRGSFDDAAKLLKIYVKNDLSQEDQLYGAMRLSDCLLREGKREEANSCLDQVLGAVADKEQWPRVCLAYLKGQCTEADLEKAAEQDTDRATLTNYVEGLNSLVNRNVLETKKRFKNVLAKSSVTRLEYELALNDLKRLGESVKGVPEPAKDSKQDERARQSERHQSSKLDNQRR